ncbi:MAG: glycosyltransferase [Paludibacteraceae bacterium]|nr:glycosyltransferase [Paludibacteraceae bacterium]
MTILHLVECGGGVEQYLLLLTSKLKEYNLRQILLCSNRLNANLFDDKVDVVEQVDIVRSLSPIKIMKGICQIRSLVKKYNPDVLYLHSSIAGGLGRLATLGINVKIVYNPHGWAFNISNFIYSKFYLFLEKILSYKTNRIVCISSSEKDCALKKKICKEEKLHVILNGIDLEYLKKVSPIDRCNINVGSDAFLVGMIGRISKQKAPDVFLKACLLISKKIPNAEFLIIGDGKYRSQMEHMAVKYGIKLHITGWVNNPYAYLKSCDMMMLLSRWEGFGLAIVEYMAAQKNFVATRVDAIPTITKEGVDCFLVDKDDYKAAADAVIKLYENPDLAEKQRVSAELHSRQFDINRVAKEHMEMFESL